LSNLSKNDDCNDIENSIDNLTKHINELLKKIDDNVSEINNLKASDIKFINDISKLKKNILALQTEDQHIFKILNELISITKTIESDNVNLNDEIISLKEKIRFLTGVNVDNIETLEGANRRLTKLENSDKEFKITIDEIKDNINSIIEKTNGDFLLLENIINDNISLLETKIDNLTDVNKDFLNGINNINEKIKKLEDADEDLRTLIENITGLDSEFFDILYDVDKINKDLIELRNHVDKIKVPTKVSELENDKNYLTEQDIPKLVWITDLDL
jgi:exonuclease VII small subunit